MPGDPASCLVVIQASFAFGIFKVPFDPEALALHLCQPLGRGVGCCIAQGVFDLIGMVYFAANDQAPMTRLFFLAVP